MPSNSALGKITGRGWWLLISGCMLVILIAFLLPRHRDGRVTSSASTNTTESDMIITSPSASRARPFRQSGSATITAPTAEEIVASKVSQFARNRRQVLHRMAAHYEVEVPDDVERFFEAVEAGRWEEIVALEAQIAKRHQADPPFRDIDLLWPVILDVFGAAEQAHDWPAQKLLDYGNATLDALRPGMVYVGGTDPGRWIPALLNASDGERHVAITQNQLVDGSYAEYLQFLYGDRIAMLTREDSEHAYKDYVTDYQKRLAHDQQFPDEPKQIRPGESDGIRIGDDGKVSVYGPNSQVSVFAINEKLLQLLMEKNPDVAFALQESFPLKSTYADAAPLGPITELRASDGQNALTPERAAQSVDYWRAIAQQLVADGETSESSENLKAFSKLAVGQANLFAERNFIAEAEGAYRVASQILPANVEAVYGLSEILTRTDRGGEAAQLLEDFVRKYPNQRGSMEQLRKTRPVSVTRIPSASVQ